MKINIYIFLAVAILLAACENDMDFKGEIHDPKLNVNAVVVPTTDGGLHIIQVLESVSAWGYRGPRPVNDATFKIWHNSVEIPVGSTTHEDGTEFSYTFSATVVAGDRLDLEGHSPLHETVSASTVVPRAADIRDIKVEAFTQSGGFGIYLPGNSGETSYMRTFITIDDPSGEKNYYAINIYSITHSLVKSEKWDPVTESVVPEFRRVDTEEWHPVHTDDEILFENIDGTPTSISSWSQFSDELIDGREYTLNVYAQITREGYGLDFMPGENEWGTWVLGKSVRVEVLSLSAELFQYQRSAELARYQLDNPFAEPVQIYSNIENGYGIFGAYNIASKTMPLSSPNIHDQPSTK